MVRTPTKKAQETAAHENGAAEAHELHLEADAPEAAVAEIDEESDADMAATLAAVGVVGVGVAIVEAALLPGVILGVAAVAAPKYFPKIGAALRPMFKHTIKGVYRLSQKTKELMAETHEHVQDIVAEVDAEGKAEVGKESLEAARV